MRPFHRFVLFCSVFVLILTQRITAFALLYDNGAPDQTTGFDMTQWIEADDFALSAAAVINNVKFWDLEKGGNFQSTIVWQIYSNSASNTPSTLLFTGVSSNLTHVATGGSAYGYVEFVNTFDISPVSLQPGTYWLCLHNGPLTNIADQLVFWEGTRNIGPLASQNISAPFNGAWVTNVFAPRVSTFGVNRGIPQISFDTISNQYYNVVYKNNVTDGSWTSVIGANLVVGTGLPVQASDTDPNIGNMSHRFYRIRTAADVAFQLNGIPGPTISAVAVKNNAPQISFTTVTGQNYRVEYQNNLGGLQWTPVTGAVMVSGTGDIVQISDSDPNVMNLGHRFYRVVLL